MVAETCEQRWASEAGAIRLTVNRRIVIRGRVQGVGYRAWTEVTALEYGLEGWVRNRRDGTVEVLFTGPEQKVAAMIEACRNGPPGSRVDAIDQRQASVDELELRRRDELFSVLGTA
jgi:acylphosphatase